MTETITNEEVNEAASTESAKPATKPWAEDSAAEEKYVAYVSSYTNGTGDKFGIRVYDVDILSGLHYNGHRCRYIAYAAASGSKRGNQRRPED